MLKTMKSEIARIAALLIASAVSSATPAGEKPAADATASNLKSTAVISADAVRPHVEYLASPRLEGRGTARGKKLARDYLCRQFEELQLEPLFGKSGYIQE